MTVAKGVSNVRMKFGLHSWARGDPRKGAKDAKYN